MNSFLGSLKQHIEVDRPHRQAQAPLLNFSLLEKRPTLIVLDYDAIICSFKYLGRSLARLDRLRTVIGKLCENHFKVAIYSERSQEQLERSLETCLDRIWLCAEMGMSIHCPGQDGWNDLQGNQVPQEEGALQSNWWNKIHEILQYYAERTHGSWIEHKRASLIWHYEQADDHFSSRYAKECQLHVQDAIGSSYPVHVIVRHKRLEVHLVGVIYVRSDSERWG